MITQLLNQVNTLQLLGKFIKEFTDNNYCKLTFGSGTNNDQEQLENIGNFGIKIGDFINTTALGEVLKPNTTLFVKYRVGGGPVQIWGLTLLIV